MFVAEKPLFQMTDDELRAALVRGAPTTGVSAGDVVAELDRRASAREARTTRAIALASTIFAAVAAFAAAVAAIASMSSK